MILAVTGMVAWLSVFLLFRGTNRSFSRMRAALARLLEHPAAGDFEPHQRSPMELEFAAAERRSRELLRELSTARAQLERLAGKQPRDTRR